MSLFWYTVCICIICTALQQHAFLVHSLRLEADELRKKVALLELEVEAATKTKKSSLNDKIAQKTSELQCRLVEERNKNSFL